MLQINHSFVILIITSYQAMLQWDPSVLDMIAALLNLAQDMNNLHLEISFMTKWQSNLYPYWGQR